MERISAPADDDAGPQNDDGEAFLPVHLHQHVFGGRLGARIIVAALDIAVERCVFRDRSGTAAGVEGVDRAGVNQPLDASLEAGAGQRAGRLDFTFGELVPGLRVGCSEMKDSIDAIENALEIGLGAHVRPFDLEPIASQLLERRAGASGRCANGIALVQQLPDQLPTDEAGTAKDEDGRLEPCGRLRSRSARPGPSAWPWP